MLPFRGNGDFTRLLGLSTQRFECSISGRAPLSFYKVPLCWRLSNFFFKSFFLLPLSPQIVKIFSEDGMGKVVEIPADMTARDLCQLLVYKSHCVDDNSWALVEHHPLLGLGKG